MIAAAFYRMSRALVTRLSSIESPDLGSLARLLDPIEFGQAVRRDRFLQGRL
jgi:hypothetical protein